MVWKTLSTKSSLELYLFTVEIHRVESESCHLGYRIESSDVIFHERPESLQNRTFKGALLGISKGRGGMVVSRHIQDDFDHFE